MNTKTETRRSFYVEQAREEILGLYREGYVTFDEVEGWAENGDIHQAANEFATGHEVAIYYSKQDDLWAAGVLSDYEADADDLTETRDDEGPGEFVRRYITTLVVLFLEDCYSEGHGQALDVIREIEGE